MKFQIEKISDIWDELQVNYEAHWHETEEYRHGQKLNMDKPRYVQYEDMGLYFMYTARDGDKLAGNLGIYVMPSMHTQVLVASEDTLFLLPEYRCKGHAQNFTRHVEAELKSMGVIEVIMDVKITNKVYKFVEREGYERIGYKYSKHINEV